MSNINGINESTVVRFIAAYTTASLRLKVDKWQQMLDNADYQAILLEWMNSDKHQTLIITLNASGTLTPTLSINEVLFTNIASGTVKSENKRQLTASSGKLMPTALLSSVPQTAPFASGNVTTTLSRGPTHGKCLYFIKQHLNINLKTQQQDFRNHIIYGDFPLHHILNTLAHYFEEIIQPLLIQNRTNRKLWPDPVNHDLEKSVRYITNTLIEIRSKVNNQTILSLHSGLEAIRSNVQLRESGELQTTVEPSMRPLLEEIIIDWILKMNQVVKQTSEYSINLKTNRKNIIHVCLPVHEINYWLSRRQNLEHLYEQLLNPMHKEVILLLKGLSSTYYPIFLKSYQQLVQAIQEARDNSLWLYPLLLQTTAFTSIQFINADKLILPLIHCLHLIWVNASYYQSTTRMTTLLRCCYNFMVFRAEEDLDITSLFGLDAEESLRKISKTLQILEYFRSCIMEYKIKYSAKSSSSGTADVESSPHIWHFSESEVFHSTMETYMHQLFELKQIFEAVTSFLQLEKLEIGGYRGKSLTKHIKQLYVGFKATFEKLCHWKAYAIRSRNSASSATPYNESGLFFHHSHILEKTLSNILIQAFTDCRDWEQLSKLTLMFKNILQRDAICQEVKMVLTHILYVYDEELRIIESNSHVVSEELTCIEDIRHVMAPEFYNFPPVIVALMWLENLLKKGCELEKPEMHKLINKLLDANSDLSAQYQMLISRQHTLMSKFENLKLNIFNDWFEGIEECLTRGLNANVWTLSHNSSNENINTADNGEDLKQLDVNLVSDVFQTLLETKYLLAMQNISGASKTITLSQYAVDLKQKLPSALLDLYQHSDEFWQYKVKLLKTAQYYNAIQEKIIVDKKLKLISTQVECIDSFVEQATESIKWQNYNDQFIDDILLKCYKLYETIETTQSNLDSIVSSIRCWSQEPLHQRSLFGARKFFNLCDQKERCKPRLLLCEGSMLLLKRLLEDNFRLFLSQSDHFDFGNEQAFQQLLSALKDEQKTNIYKYLDNVCDIICEEVLEGMRISLQFILSEITKRMQTYAETKLKDKITGNISTALQTLTALPTKKDGENLSSISGNSPLYDTFLRKKTPTPSKQTLIEVQLNLVSNEIGFEPSFEENIQNNFHDIFEALFRDISYTSTYFLELVDENVFSNYMKDHNGSRSKPRHLAEVIREMYKEGGKQEETLDMNDIKQLMDTIRASIRKSTNAAKAFALEFKVYSHLWIEKYGKLSCDRSHDIGINTSRHVVDGIKQIIDKYNGIHENISKLEELQCIDGWLAVNIKPFKYTLLNLTCKWINYYKKRLLRYIKRALEKFDDFIYNGSNLLQLHISRDDLGILLQMLHIIIQIREREGRADNLFKASKDAVTLLKSYGFNYTSDILQKINQLILQWNQLKMIAATKLGMIQENKLYQQQQISTRIQMYGCYVQSFHKRFQRMPFFKVPCRDVYVLCDKVCIQLRRYLKIKDSIMYCAKLLDIETPKFTILQTCEMQLKNIKHLWDFVYAFESRVEHWHSSAWLKIDTDDIESDCKQFTRDLRTLDKTVRNWTPYLYVTALVKETNSSIRLINDLQNPALKEHHWMKLMKTIKLTKIHSIDYLVSLKEDANTKLHQLLSLDLYKFEEDIKNALDCAVKEMAVTKVLDDIDSTWSNMEFGAELHDRRNEVQLLKISTEFIEVLDDNQMQLQNISASNHGEQILNKIHHWQTVLTKIDSFITIWFEVQRKWCYLEKIFIGSLDIRNQLHEEAIYFQEIDDTFIKLLQEIVSAHKAINVVLEHKHVFELLDELQQRLVHSEKALHTYLESKRLVFPRFYFISSTDLLDILSNGNLPQTMDRHLIKLFDSILRLSYKKETPSQAIAMISKENNEYVRFVSDHVECSGKVELWLEALKKEMRNTLHGLFGNALQAVCGQQARELWIFDWPAQVALCCSQICWTTEVNRAFALLESGYEASMKDLHRRQICQLNTLINLLLGELTPGDRQKIMTICTIDVHSRDVINKIICNEVSNPLAFPWQSQLRHRWDFTEQIKNDQNIRESSYDFQQDCFANICDAEFQYAYEYLGNSTRLVITPLTDRCYITLTQSLHLVMGGAPAGPAGTGKTETTKDLGRALGVMVYVFNCSEQMDYKSCANIYKGLAQTGAWGCFDEFNRISVEVLSVIAVQVKTIQEAIKMQKTVFVFMGETIKLAPSVGIFITMNPGYAGRTELPENLKALFRPCAMIVPDIALICEIMLMAEGFQDARRLARKFITLYTLCKELLSKQDHYDWGLRAIKSVLVVAGSLKRNDRNRPEEQVLMRALRDFNIPKIVTEDITIFTDLIGDLFPAVDIPRKRSLAFEKAIRRAIVELRLQPEEGFLMKVVQLEELLNVRHSVFIVGNAGTGKTKIWQTLLKTYSIQKLEPISNILNPKALTNDELFGIVNATTREWKDGLFSFIMRNQSNLENDNPKWIVLDGDIDPLWIESLNTLMDDNKILTLANNERITLRKTMRLLFEVGHLRAATPATVSRAGVLYINPQDLNWSSYVLSWLDTRENLIERSILNTLFERYYPKLIQREQRHTIPITEIAMIQTSCHLLECLLDEAAANQDYNEGESPISKASLSHGNTGSVDSLQLHITFIFIYATMWGFGSTLHEDHLISWRHEFHKWWITEFKDIKLPTHGTIFDYYFDLNTQQFIPWKEYATQQQVECLDLDKPLQETTIQTAETLRLTYFLKLLIGKNLPCMLLGTTGCGKGTIFRELFKNFTNPQEIKSKKRIPSPSLTRMVQTTQLNYYTTSEILQKTFERSLEKKPGKWYGPIGSKQRLIYFIRDFNMSKVDAYGTIRSHTIIRQFMDYEQWYDRQQLCLKNIRNCQFAVCMNPTSGSFTIDPRLQRHFCTFSLVEPNEESLQYIYGSILQLHLDNPHNTFGKDIKLIGNTLVKIGVSFHKRVKSLFLPTALKFHYTFNMRDLTNIYQNVVNTIGTMSPNEAATAITNTAALTNFNGTICSKPSDMIRLYVHEAFRVYHDRLVERCDMKSFKSAIRDFFKKDFEELDEDFVFSEPLIYCHFTQSLGDQKYMPITNWKSLYDLVTEAQTIYNDVIGHINLVLFEDALNHLCRINRVLESPSNNALLVGVGGSGKQTLTRLASFISSMNVYQIQIRRNFGVQDMKDEISELYMKVGLKNVSSVLLISDAQIPEESLLIYINDFLASGEIPDLFNDDQIENIINAIRNEVKQHGIQDTKENSWRFLVEKVKRLLKIVLCFSPVGRNFRLRARKFPAIINNTYIDWFHDWPSTALESVSQNFLKEISEEILPRRIIESISYFMAFVHDSVNQISTVYKQNERRFNYTTPKTFLEYIFLYRKLLIEKTDENRQRITRLKNGMAKLAECSQQVQNLKSQLAEQQIQLNAKNEATDKLIFVVTAESERVKNEKNIAHEEERRVRIIEEDVSIKTKVCEEDLRRAEPALVAAQAALNTLNKGNLTELKSFGSPPKAVVNVCSAVMVLLAIDGKIPHDRSWKAAKLMMVRIDQFLNDLINYNKENIHDNVIEVLQEYLQDPEFDPDKVVQKSVAAAGLCAWVINIYRYHQIFLLVGPKQKALKDSQEELRDARKRLHFLQLKIINLEKKLHNIQDELEEAVIAKQKCQQETDRTVVTINTAHRLVNGLANENVRWKECVQSLIDNLSTLPGDMLLISSFLTYTGCFTKRYRKELQEKLWMPYFRNIQPSILHTDVDDHICLFTDDAQIAVWNNDGLPMDRMSMENATILTNSSRWPLMIDPQLQGIKWIKNTFGKTLIVLQLNEKNFLEKLEAAICNGSTVLIENIEEKIDTVLDPLLSRLLIKKNRYIRIADRELEYNANFRLILHTKLANPHYKPELQAQTTLINFTVTPDGLEEQLLAEVVKVERPDLEDMKSKLTVQQNKFKITLKELENELLARLASAGENILDDHDLVRNLESTKYTVNEIELKVNEARATSMQIDDARNLYRPAAKRAAELYFVLVDLAQINPMYKFSLKLYMHVFKQAISLTLPESRQEKRVTLLVNSITLKTFHYTLRALFEVDKLTFIAHMTLRLMASSMPICREEIDFLLRFPCDYSSVPPVDFINRVSWAGIKSLAMLEEFYGLDKDIECYHKLWRKYVVSSTPECEQLPGEWKNRSPLQRLCILRTLRPDRVSNAIRYFIEETMGKEYTTIKSHTFSDIFKDVTPNIPVIFVLSPGVDPIKDVEDTAYKLGFNVESLINISLGQGQEILAEQAIAEALESNQKWVILQNIHLVKSWLPILDSEIQRISDANMSHTLNFRLFLTAEPAPDPKYHLIPQGILESSLKIINEPPSGLRENFLKAWSNFTEETLETCTQEAEFKSVLFALCFFHAVSSQRHKFGPLGWNKTYPFNMGDLTISASVLHNYLESSNRIPWEDLRYLFGEIMYGGHITNDWDRRLCHTYLEELLQQDLIDTDFQLCPGFCAPPNLDYLGYHDYITEMLPGESPALYGLHPNAEISFLTNTSERMLRTVFELQPRESELSAICGTPREELVKVMAEDFLEKLKEEFNMQSLLARIECKTPFVVVALQETERMNMLIREIKRSLHGLIKGLKGELTLTAEMERLDYALFYDHVPECWMSLAYPSVLNLQSWFTDLLHRIRELSMWLNDFKLPSSVWLGSLFNPQSFLTAIMQESARKQNLPLDRLCLHSDVTKSTYDDISLPPTDGAFVHGLYLEGASWSTHLNSIVSLQSKELFCLMPVIYLKSVVQEKEDIVNTYECPLYKTRFRNETYVWSFNLKSSERPSKWILGGVALLLQP